jgi:hypothetical protein
MLRIPGSRICAYTDAIPPNLTGEAGTMVVNQDLARSLIEHLQQEHPTPERLRAAADEYESYVKRGRTMRDPHTGENISDDTLAEVVRVLRERADQPETLDASIDREPERDRSR